MKLEKRQKIAEKVTVRVDKILTLSIFDEPRPKYIAKVNWIDKILAVSVLKLIPRFVRPNFVTTFRFITIPFIIFFIVDHNYNLGMGLFIISACSDAIDGALARTRDQITDWGIVFDPFADKLLISSVAVVLISQMISPILTILIVVLEIMLIAFSYFRFKGRLVPAKTAGKLKMIFQSVGVSFLLLALVTGQIIFITIATYILYLAVAFALVSLLVYRSI